MGVPCVYTLYLQGVARRGAIAWPCGFPAKLRPGDNLELSVEGSGTVRIRKKKGTSKLRDLIREITAANLHTETDWGAPEGKELW